MLSSILNSVYNFYINNIFEDLKYSNIKKNKLMVNMYNVVKIWSYYFYIFCNTENSKIIEEFAKFIIYNTQYTILPEFLQTIFES